MKTLALAGLVLLAACRQPPSEKVATTSVELPAASVRVAPSSPGDKGGCDTLIDVEEPETLRQARTGLVLYANEQVGLAVVDVSDPDRPEMKGVVELDGEPAGVFFVRGIAVLVYSPAARPGTVAIRAVALDPTRSLGEMTLAGNVRDVRRVGDFVILTRQTSDGQTRVTSLGIRESGVSSESEVVLGGSAAVAGAAPNGVAIARTAEAARTAVTWLGVDPNLGSLTTRGTVLVSGVVPMWRSSRRVLDVTEDSRVRLVLCGSDACESSTPAAYAAIDFSRPAEPRVTAWRLVAGAGDGTIGFQGTRLIVARPASDRSDASELAFYDTEADLVPAGRVRVRGSVGSIAVQSSGDVMTVGWTGSLAVGKRAVIHHIDARGAPHLVGAAAFGGDWTWSRAYEDDRVLGFDPISMLAALPMTTVRGASAPTNAAQVLALDPKGPRALAEESLPFVDRVMFVSGRLLAFSPDGVVVLGREGEAGSAYRFRTSERGK